MSKAVKNIFAFTLAVLLIIGQPSLTFATNDESDSSPYSAGDSLNLLSDAEIGLSESEDSGSSDNANEETASASILLVDDSGDNDTVSGDALTVENTENNPLPGENNIDLISDIQPEEADEDVVFSEQELLDWLTAHQNIGGTVSLGCSIHIATGKTILNYGGSLTINTGAYSLVYDGGGLSFGGDAHIIGEGVNMPVLEVKDLGVMRIGDWSNVLNSLNVTAVGRDGLGGVAVRICSSGSGRHDKTFIYSKPPGKILSYGEGAVGLELIGDFSAYCFDIAVEGENSVAVVAPKFALLSFCRLSATGYGAVCVRGDGVVLDTCLAQPDMGEGIHSYVRRFEPAYLMMKQNSSVDDLLWELEKRYIYIPLVGGEVKSAFDGLIVMWDYDMCMDVDLSSTGITTVSGEIYASYQPFWLDNFLDTSAAASMVIDVRDPDIPCIYEVRFVTLSTDGEEFAELRLWQSERWTLDDCILWRSDDSGDTWYDYSEDAIWEQGMSDGVSSVSFPVSTITDGCMVQIEVPGIGESNIIVFSFVDGQPTGDQGGDRTGADRAIGVKPGCSNGGNSGDASNPGNSDNTGDGANPGDASNPGNGGNTGDGANPSDSGNPGDGANPGDTGNHGNGGNAGDGANPGDAGDIGNGGSPDDNGTPDSSDSPDRINITADNGSGRESEKHSVAPFAAIPQAPVLPVFPQNPGEDYLIEANKPSTQLTTPSQPEPQAKDHEPIPQRAQPDESLVAFQSSQDTSASTRHNDTGPAIPIVTGVLVLSAGGYAFLKLCLKRWGGSP